MLRHDSDIIKAHSDAYAYAHPVKAPDTKDDTFVILARPSQRSEISSVIEESIPIMEVHLSSLKSSNSSPNMMNEHLDFGYGRIDSTKLDSEDKISFSTRDDRPTQETNGVNFEFKMLEDETMSTENPENFDRKENSEVEQEIFIADKEDEMEQAYFISCSQIQETKDDKSIESQLPTKCESAIIKEKEILIEKEANVSKLPNYVSQALKETEELVQEAHAEPEQVQLMSSEEPMHLSLVIDPLEVETVICKGIQKEVGIMDSNSPTFSIAFDTKRKPLYGLSEQNPKSIEDINATSLTGLKPPFEVQMREQYSKQMPDQKGQFYSSKINFAGQGLAGTLATSVTSLDHLGAQFQAHIYSSTIIQSTSPSSLLHAAKDPIKQKSLRCNSPTNMLDNELEVMENSKVSSGVPLDLTLKSIIQIAPTHLSARHGIQIQNGVKSQEEMPTQYEATYLKDNQSEVGLSIMSLTPLLVQSAPPRLTVSANPNSEKNRMDVTSIDDLVTYNAPDLSNSNLPNPHLVQKEDYGRIIFPQDHASQLAIKTEYSQEELVGSNSRHGAVSSDTPGLSKLNIGSDDNLSGSETLAGQHEFWRMRNMDVAEETKTVARSHIEDIASTHLLSRPISDVETKFTDDLSTVLTDSALLGYKEVGQQVQETRAASPLLETMEECDRLNNLILKDGELEIITKTTTEIIARPTKTVTATSTKNSPLFVKHSECSFTLKPKEESTIDVCQFQPQINKEKLLNSQELSNQVEVSKMRDTILDPERRPLSLNTTITWPSSNYHQKYTNSTPDRPVQSLMETVDLASFDALHIPLNSDLQICESRHVLASKEKKAKTTVCPSPMYSSSVAAMTGAPQLTGHRPYMEKNSFLLFPSILFDYQGQPFLYDLKRINSKERKKRDKATLGTLDAMIRDTLQTVRHHRLA